MIYKKIFFYFLLIFSFLPFNFIFAEETNIGFVSGNIWYSKDDPVVGEKIKIYTFIFNPDAKELSGTVVFFDKNTLLGKKDFIIGPKKASDISIDWTVTEGDHIIFGKIENPKFLVSKGKYEEIYLEKDETEKSKISIGLLDKEEEKSIEKNSPFVEDIKENINKYIPDSISEPISSTIETAENFRIMTNDSSIQKKDSLKNEINLLKENTNEDKKENIIKKPLKYIELFLYSLAQFIFNSKILFYGILILIIFSIFRFIFNKFF